MALSLIDSIELDFLAETGDIEVAVQLGMAMRYACDQVTQLLADILGLGPSFVADMHASLG